MVEIRSQKENNELYKKAQMTGCDRVWIGLRQTSNTFLKWSSGNNINYKNFQTNFNEATLSKNRTYCAQMYLSSPTDSNKWFTVDCSNLTSIRQSCYACSPYRGSNGVLMPTGNLEFLVNRDFTVQTSTSSNIATKYTHVLNLVLQTNTGYSSMKSSIKSTLSSSLGSSNILLNL